MWHYSCRVAPILPNKRFNYDPGVKSLLQVPGSKVGELQNAFYGHYWALASRLEARGLKGLDDDASVVFIRYLLGQ